MKNFVDQKDELKRNQFIEDILHFDRLNDIDEFIKFVQKESYELEDIEFILSHLFMNSKIRPAYIVSMVLANLGYQMPMIGIGLCVGGLAYKSDSKYDEGCECLLNYQNIMHHDVYEAEQQLFLYNRIILPAMIALLDLAEYNPDQIARFAEMLKSAVPFIWKLFESERSVIFLSPDDYNQRLAVKIRFVNTKCFLDHLLQLDDNNELIQFIQNNAYTIQDVLLVILQLLIKQRLAPAYVCAMLLANAGYRHVLIAMALSFGGLRFDNPQEKQRGLIDLRAHVDALSDEQRAIFNNVLMAPLVYTLINHFTVDDEAKLRQILEILTTASPIFAALLATNQTVPVVGLTGLQQQGRAKAQLLYAQDVVEVERPVELCQVVVAMQDPGLSDQIYIRCNTVGVRLEAALNRYGWQAEFFGMHCASSNDEYRRIAKKCLQMDTDILILDYDLIVIKNQELTAIQMITQLKQKKPTLKVVAFIQEARWHTVEALTGNQFYFDLLWVMDSPATPLWNEPAFADKVLFSLIPVGVDLPETLAPLQTLQFFSGRLHANWLPLLWLLAAKEAGIPVKQQVVTHQPVGSAWQVGYGDYLQQLADAGCCLNFSRRPDQSTRLNGRSLEVILSGGLLVQESTPHLDYFLISGEHYLAFSTLSEWLALTRLMAENPQEIEKIRRNGHDFARKHYSDKQLIARVDQRLYGQEAVGMSLSVFANSQQGPKSDSFQIVMCLPMGFSHSNCFLELAQTLQFALHSLGYQAEISHTFSFTARNIILGAHLLTTAFTPHELASLPADSILYNIEQMDIASLAMQSQLLRYIQRFETWDYSLRNIERLHQAGINSAVKYLPIGYVPELTRIPEAAVEDIDILFYGSLCERRKVVLADLEEAGVRVHHAFGVYGAERDALISRAKIVLNMHFYDAAIFESVRVSYLLANRKAVVAECGPTTEMDEGLRDGVELAPYEGLAAACLALLRDEKRRREVAQRGYECMLRRSESLLMQPLLDLESVDEDLEQQISPVVSPLLPPMPMVANLGSGKAWRADCLNVDCTLEWRPDLLLDLNHPLPFGMPLSSDRFGTLVLMENQMETLIATDLLSHLDQLTVAMKSALHWLKPEGQLMIQVPYDLSLGAWQDPAHLRAFNENSWLYYTDWFWYLGWNEARFELVELTYLLSAYGKELHSSGTTLHSLRSQARCVDGMKVILRKRLLTPEEKEIARQFQSRSGATG